MFNRNLYEKYHDSIKIQKRLITPNDFTYRLLLNRIENYIPLEGRVLDIGSAVGTLAFYFGSKGLPVDGIEISVNAVKSANINKKTLNLKNVHFYNLPIENYATRQKYSLVTCFEVIEHLDNDTSVLKSIKKYMRRDSILAISVPSVNSPLYRWGFLKDFDLRVGHLRRYSMSSLKGLLKNSGYQVVKCFKTEGVIRNSMFTIEILGFLVKFMRFRVLNNLVTFLDEVCLNIFGECQLIIICKKK